MAYVLPFYVSEFQTKIRLFRVALPESQYASVDQDVFRKEFSIFIDQSKALSTFMLTL